MNACRLDVKLYFDPAYELDPALLIPIFHHWIRDHELDELAIDVADYKHVPDGPGVMLITHEANYAVESIDGRLGLAYLRKRPAEGAFPDRLRDALARAIRAGRLLERESTLAGLAIPGASWALRIRDRLLAPPTGATYGAVEPALRSLLDELYADAGYALDREDDPKAGFGVRVTAASGPGLAALAQRLEAASFDLAAKAA